jgi:thiol:disulfide interchange protein
LGIGLGFPYLALCAYPGFVRFLPKPGAWMETLKQVLAFPLLLTVVYMVQIVSPDYRIATLILLIVVWFACWLIGRVPPYSEVTQIRQAWLFGLGTIAAGATISFSVFGPIKHHLPWENYNEAQLAEYRREGKTVMVEFTARWCLTCQANMRFAIDRKEVAEVCKKNNVITMLADKSEKSPAIDKKLEELGSISIPLLAIYPPDTEPIVLRDTITQGQLIDALEEAGPSRADGEMVSRSVSTSMK